MTLDILKERARPATSSAFTWRHGRAALQQARRRRVHARPRTDQRRTHGGDDHAVARERGAQAVGLDYYWTNQWCLSRPGVPLSDTDQRHVPLREIVRGVWERYGSELLVIETSHVGDRRGGWVREVADEAEALVAEGVPLRGVGLYPILGMPEWHERGTWTRTGLWDLMPPSPTLARRPYAPMLAALRGAA